MSLSIESKQRETGQSEREEQIEREQNESSTRHRRGDSYVRSSGEIGTRHNQLVIRKRINLKGGIQSEGHSVDPYWYTFTLTSRVPLERARAQRVTVCNSLGAVDQSETRIKRRRKA